MKTGKKIIIIIIIIILVVIAGYCVYRYYYLPQKVASFQEELLKNATIVDLKNITGIQGKINNITDSEIAITTEDGEKVFKLTNDTKIKTENEEKSDYVEVEKSELEKGLKVLVLYNDSTKEATEIDIIK